MKKLLIILCAALLCGGVYAAVGDLHSAFAEFSNVNNPNGNWSYHVGQQWTDTVPNPDVIYPYDTLSSLLTGGQWAPPAGAGGPYSRIGGGGPSNEPNAVAMPLGAHSPFMTRYTVPADVNAVECCLSYIQQYEPGRHMRMMIKLNGVTIAQRESIQPLSNDYPNNGATWAQFFPNQAKGFKFNVFAGDEIDFLVDAYGSLSTNPGTGTTSSFTSWVREIEALPTFELTVNTNPSHITTVTNLGTSTQAKNEDIPLVASQYDGCLFDPEDSRVYVFSSWTGPVANSGSASTTVNSAGQDITVTANYVIDSECLDACHPSPAYDFNDDCITDLVDFATFAATWLDCTQPVCID